MGSMDKGHKKIAITFSNVNTSPRDLVYYIWTGSLPSEVKLFDVTSFGTHYIIFSIRWVIISILGQNFVHISWP